MAGSVGAANQQSSLVAGTSGGEARLVYANGLGCKFLQIYNENSIPDGRFVLMATDFVMNWRRIAHLRVFTNVRETEVLCKQRHG